MRKALLLLAILFLLAIGLFFTYSNQEYKKLTPAKESNPSIKDDKHLKQKQEEIPTLKVKLKKEKKKKVKPSVIEVIPEYEALSETDLLIQEFEQDITGLVSALEDEEAEIIEEIIAEIESEFNFE